MRPQERSPEERLINLMVSLSTSRAPRTFAQLRRDTVAYVQPDDESARRMFERDKDALRRMGVPIETVDTGGVPGYQINRDDWVAHDIHLDRDEVAALAVGIALGGGPTRTIGAVPTDGPGTRPRPGHVGAVDATRGGG